jgi:cyclopropane-fatty-acyl-phospholipid synthase
MNRSRVDPLGVPGTDEGFGEDRRQPAAGKRAGSLDRWVLGQLTAGLDESRVRVLLWDEPDPAADEKRVVVRITDRSALWQLIVNPMLRFGDLYSTGRIRVTGDLLTLLDEAYRYTAENTRLSRALARGRISAPSLLESRRNIHHHYDIGNEFYELWLDREALQYTCAYYAQPTMTLEQAQQAKMHHVCRKVRLQADERVAEAGSGWGGFAIFMAKNYGVRVRSFNISKEQVAYAREWAQREGLQQRVEFVEDDYRNMSGTYDAFVSIGMLEHVGAGDYERFGALINRVLTPDGRGLIHSIGRDKPERMNPWIEKRIFPGAYPPTLREMMDIFEPNGLSVLDVENIRLHYAQTLRGWLDRYEQNIDQVRAMFDDTFVRAWRLYLSGSIVAFLRGTLQLFQISFARTGANQIPWTREHIYAHGE